MSSNKSNIKKRWSPPKVEIVNTFQKKEQSMLYKPEEPNKININNELELDYWSNKFEVHKDKLKRAVHTVGPMKKDVQEWIEYNFMAIVPFKNNHISK